MVPVAPFSVEVQVSLPVLNYYPGNHAVGVAGTFEDSTVVDDHYQINENDKTTPDLGSHDRVNIVEAIMFAMN